VMRVYALDINGSMRPKEKKERKLWERFKTSGMERLRRMATCGLSNGLLNGFRNSLVGGRSVWEEGRDGSLIDIVHN